MSDAEIDWIREVVRNHGTYEAVERGPSLIDPAIKAAAGVRTWFAVELEPTLEALLSTDFWSDITPWIKVRNDNLPKL